MLGKSMRYILSRNQIPTTPLLKADVSSTRDMNSNLEFKPDPNRPLRQWVAIGLAQHIAPAAGTPSGMHTCQANVTLGSAAFSQCLR